MPGWAASLPVTKRCRRCRSSTPTAPGCTGRPSGSGRCWLLTTIKAGPYLAIAVTESSHAGLALAIGVDRRGDSTRRPKGLLNDSALLDTWENHQWQQYITAYLMYATQRWPDVISVAAKILPPQAIIMSAVTAATNTLAAHAAAHLGQASGGAGLGGPGRAALDAPVRRWRRADEKAHRRDGRGHRPERRFPFFSIAADLAYVRGMAHRQLGEEDKAQIALSKATINGLLIPAAQQALADPTFASGGHRRGDHRQPDQPLGFERPRSPARDRRAGGERSAVATELLAQGPRTAGQPGRTGPR